MTRMKRQANYHTCATWHWDLDCAKRCAEENDLATKGVAVVEEYDGDRRTRAHMKIADRRDWFSYTVTD